LYYADHGFEVTGGRKLRRLLRVLHAEQGALVGAKITL
jgi:hypothetical protein